MAYGLQKYRWAVCVLSLWSGVAVAVPPQLDIPMERTLRTFKLRFGMLDKEPSTCAGTLRLTAGRIIAAYGWRFTGNDYVTAATFSFQNRCFYPRFYTLRGRDPKTLPIEPNGIVLTCADLTADSLLEVSTAQGDFSVPVGTLGYGGSTRFLERRVEVERIPTSRQVVKAATEDAYPSAVMALDGASQVCYLAFTHGEGFATRRSVPEEPEDFSFLSLPTGGDQAMFVEMRDGEWSAPVALSEPGADLFGTAIAAGGDGRTWAFWAANVDENWDLYATTRRAGAWSSPMRVTSASGSDFSHAATTDAEGRVWLVWQSLRAGNSDIYAARQAGDGLGEPLCVAGSRANEWAPAIAASADGQVAVAWDTYERGNYDVVVRTWRGGNWSEPRVVAGSSANEARPSVAFDGENRLWIAYEVSPEGWGKDFGPYDRSPSKTALYRSREVGLRVIVGAALYTTEADLGLALPLPDGNRRWPKSKKQFLVAGPKVTVDASGRVWLSVRVRIVRFDSGVGGTWLSFLSMLDGGKWRSAVLVPETDGFLHESSALVPGPGSGVLAVSASDGRLRAGAHFGLEQKQRRRTGKDLPPSGTRRFAVYPDWLFNKELTVADTGPVARQAEQPVLVKVAWDQPAGESVESRVEAEHVAAIRAYRADVRGRELRIWRGEFHRHTELSGDGAGDGTIFDMWRYGLDMAALDWIGNGDHDNGGGREFTWWFTQKTTSLFHIPGAFTPMYTYERSCRYPDGHRNAVFAQRGIRALARLRGGMGKAMDDVSAEAERPLTPDTQMFYRYLRHFDGVCASHTSGTDMGTDWRDNDPKVEPVVEIYQGDRQNYEKAGAPRSNTAQYSLGGWRPLGFVSRALKKGYRLGFQASSDHISTHMSYCNVFVEEPTRAAILDGLKKRRVYGATDNIIADVRCGEHFMGEEFAVAAPPKLHIKLIGTAPFADVVIVKDDQYVYSSSPGTSTVEFEWTDSAAEVGKTSYYYVRGTQQGTTETRTVRSPSGEKQDVELNNGEIVWVSPMWITYRP